MKLSHKPVNVDVQVSVHIPKPKSSINYKFMLSPANF